MQPIFTVLFCFMIISGYAQIPTENICSFEYMQQERMKIDPGYALRHLQMEESIYRYSISRDVLQKRNASYILPVVIHIIHNNGAENISDADVQKGLDNLNLGFANKGYYDPNTGIDTKIQFCLAKQDPDGNLTTGINRVQSRLTKLNYNVDDRTMKNLSIWDPFKYINIWLVADICNNSGCSVVGYAYFPSAHGTSIDGLVCEAAYFSGSPSDASVQIHELGHYFGLYHTFQGGCKNDNCLVDGDKICDTPPDQKVFDGTCMTNFNSCNTDAISGFSSDQIDMNWNYMDYNTFSCYSAFTPNQTDRMHYVIENIRYSLLESKACLTPCPVQISAFFNVPDTIYIGDEIDFVSQSTNVNTFEWYIGGSKVSTNNQFKYTFLKEGSFIIKLAGGNDDPNCVDFYSKKVVVICNADASFVARSNDIETGQTVVFRNTSKNGNNPVWNIDNNWVSNSIDLTYRFNSPGTHLVTLIVSDSKGLCYDTSEIRINVKCSVNTSFMPDELFPLVGGAVNFTNTSQDANTYEWSIEDIPVGRNKDFQYNFNKNGQYKVCLKASNIFCEQTYCVIIWVRNQEDSACSQNFINILGDSKGNDEAHAITFLNDGSFLIAGSHNNRSAIYHLNKNGSFIENWDFDFKNSSETLRHLIQFDNSTIISTGVGNQPNANRSTYIFKYDYKNNEIIWKNEILFPTLNFPIIYKLIKVPNGNIVGVGQILPSNCESLIFEINGVTGNLVWYKIIAKQGCDTHFSFLFTGTAYYAVGRFNAGVSASTIGMRPSLIKLDLNGNIIFQKYYLARPNIDARLYNLAICEDNGLLISTIGDISGTNLDKSKLYLSKTDYNGNIQWMKKYSFGRKYTHAKKVLNIPDGYIAYGHYFYDNSNRALYFIKIDKQGNVIWAKSIIIGKSNIQGDLEWNNGFYHIVGTTNIFGQNDVFWMRLDQDGNLWPDCDNYVQPLNVRVSNISNPFEGNMNAKVLSSGLPYRNVDIKNINNPALDSVLCVINDCIDTCDIVADARIQLIDFTCIKDSFEIQLQVCNDGNATLPTGIPVRIYSDNPSVYQTTYIGVYPLPVDLDSGECVTMRLMVKSRINRYLYFTINDSGQETTPFDVYKGLKPTSVLECNFINNLDSFQFLKPTFILDLGPDSELCEHNIQVLDGGAGFVSYVWQDGSTDRTFTAWEPGTYWVEVLDGCGFRYSDTIVLNIDKGSNIGLGADTTLCKGDLLTYGLKGYTNYRWKLNSYISCDTCGRVDIIPTQNDTLIVTANNEKGCLVSDTILINVLIPYEQYDTSSMCEGDSVIYFNKAYSIAGDYIISSNQNIACDSTYFLHLIVNENSYYDYGQLEICLGDSVTFGNRRIFNAGTYTDTFNAYNGCDSIVSINVLVHPKFQNPLSGDTLLCEGETAIIKTAKGLNNILWSTGESTEEIRINKSGRYVLNARDENDCPVQATIKINFVPLPSLDLLVGHESCKGASDGSIRIDTAGSFGNLQYYLDDRLIAPSDITNLSPGTYNIRVVNDIGCQQEEIVTINEGTAIEVALGEDFVVQTLDSAVIIDADITKGKAIKITWTIDGEEVDSNETRISFKPTGNHIIRIVVVDSNGCTSEDELLISFKVPDRIYVPNVFTPNGDGINDFFMVFAKEGNIIVDRMTIYDRWGELIYEQSNLVTNNNETRYWDGTFHNQKMNPGVFVYVVEYHLISGEEGVVKGNVTLIR